MEVWNIRTQVVLNGLAICHFNNFISNRHSYIISHNINFTEAMKLT